MDDNMILPEDFEDTPVEKPTVDIETPEFKEEPALKAEDTIPADVPIVPEEPVIEPRKLNLTYNGQDMEVSEDEARALAQKGMNYEKAVERARQEAAQQARDAVYADMGYEWQGKKITTEAEYKRAVQEKELLDKYSQLPPELAQELIDSRRDREERQREKEAKDQEAKQNADFNDFLSYYESVNERRFDPTKGDAIPQEVIAAVNSGQSLKSAYMEHHNKELRNQLKIAKQNEINTKRAPVGSVTAGGGIKTEAEDLFLKGFNST